VEASEISRQGGAGHFLSKGGFGLFRFPVFKRIPACGARWQAARTHPRRHTHTKRPPEVGRSWGCGVALCFVRTGRL